MAVADRTLTLEEFLALPEEEPALEYWDGVVTQKVSPQPDHSTLQFFLAERLNGVARPKQLGLAFTELRFSAPRYSPVPDVAYYVKERIHLRSARSIDRFREPPDIAIEIVSPSQSVSALIRKCLGYLDMGARVAVLVDPDDETVFVFRPGQPMRVLRGSDRIDLDDILPGFELTAGELFDAKVPSWLRGEETPAE